MSEEQDREKYRIIHVPIPEELYRSVRKRCTDEDRSIQHYVASLIARDMEDYGRTADARD